MLVEQFAVLSLRPRDKRAIDDQGCTYDKSFVLGERSHCIDIHHPGDGHISPLRV